MSPLSNALVGIARRSFNEFQFQFQLQSEMYLALMPTAEGVEGGRRNWFGTICSCLSRCNQFINMFLCSTKNGSEGRKEREGGRESKTERGRVKRGEV